MTGLTGEALGSTDGLTTGEATGLAVTTGTGVATGLFGNVLAFGSQAPNTAVLTAKTDANINDLLIVFSSKFCERRLTPPASKTSSQPE